MGGNAYQKEEELPVVPEVQVEVQVEEKSEKEPE